MITTQPPSPEVVEAAMKRVRCIPMTPEERAHLYEEKIHYDHVAARILAAEVERLRAQVDLLEQNNEAAQKLVHEYHDAIERMRAKEDAVCASEWRLSKGAEENPSDGTMVGECSGGQFVVFAPSKIPIYCPGCGRKVKIQPQINEQ